MVLHEFPDLTWLKKEAESSFRSRRSVDGRELKNAGWPTVILNVRTSNIFRDNIPGPLSIFSNISGHSYVEADRKRTKINDSFFFVTNPEQRYTLEADSCNTETFNIHFGHAFTEQCFQSLINNLEKSLDMPEGSTSAVPEFYNKLYRRDTQFDKFVSKLKTSQSELDHESILAGMLEYLVRHYHDDIRIKDTIPAARKSTRDEVYKRLLVAVDLIHSCYSDKLTIDQLAEVSCLSKFHFLRLFRGIFSQTPHEYLTSIRIKRSTQLLENASMDIRSIARDCGFTDDSVFYRAFISHTGFSPSQYRNQLR